MHVSTLMKRGFLLLLLTLAVTTATRAQNTTPMTQGGNKAILFTIAGLGNFSVTGSYVAELPNTGTVLDSFETLGFRIGRPLIGAGVLFYLSDNIGLRAGVSLFSSSKTTKVGNDTSGKENKHSTFGFGISPALQVHLVNSGPITVYTGALVSYGSYTITDTPADTLTGETVNAQSTFGGGVMLGVQFFPWNNISFGAEYQLGIAVSSSSNSVKGKSTDGPSYTDLGIGSFGVTLGAHF